MSVRTRWDGALLLISANVLKSWLCFVRSFAPEKPLKVFHAHLSLSWVVVFVLLMFWWGFFPKKSVKWVTSDKKSGMRGAACESLKSLWILLGVPERTASLEAWLCDWNRNIVFHHYALILPCRRIHGTFSWQFPAITSALLLLE